MCLGVSKEGIDRRLRLRDPLVRFHLEAVTEGRVGCCQRLGDRLVLTAREALSRQRCQRLSQRRTASLESREPFRSQRALDVGDERSERLRGGVERGGCLREVLRRERVFAAVDIAVGGREIRGGGGAIAVRARGVERACGSVASRAGFGSSPRALDLGPCVRDPSVELGKRTLEDANGGDRFALRGVLLGRGERRE